MDRSSVSTGSAFAIEFVTDLALILLSFGVGLDPRQRGVFGPTLGPILVGISLGLCIFTTGIIRPGYTGFCMYLIPAKYVLQSIVYILTGVIAGHPARCFGAMVGSHFSTYHWIHWVAPLCASIAHGILYFLVPPYGRGHVT